MRFADYARGIRRLRLPPDNLVVLSSVPSTNELARRIVAEYLAGGQGPPETLLLAWEQTGGRGRLGRSWVSPAGMGVYASLILGASDARTLQHLPLLAGIALARGLGRVLARPCRLKWPNDLMVEGRKIGGILVEAVYRGEQARAAVVGFGVNWGQRRSELPIAGATSVRLEARSVPDLLELTDILVRELTAELGTATDRRSVARRYEELSQHLRGQGICCRLGDELVEGTFLGFDELGRIRVSSRGGVRTISAAEVVE